MPDQERIKQLKLLKWIPPRGEEFQASHNTAVGLKGLRDDSIPAARKAKENAEEDAKDLPQYGRDLTQLEASAESTKTYKEESMKLRAKAQELTAQREELKQETQASTVLRDQILASVHTESENETLTVRDRWLQMGETLGMTVQSTSKTGWLKIPEPKVIEILEKEIRRPKPDEGGEDWQTDTIMKYILKLHKRTSNSDQAEETIAKQQTQIKELSDKISASESIPEKTIAPQVKELQDALNKSKHNHADCLNSLKVARKGIDRLKVEVQMKTERIENLKKYESVQEELKTLKEMTNISVLQLSNENQRLNKELEKEKRHVEDLRDIAENVRAELEKRDEIQNQSSSDANDSADAQNKVKERDLQIQSLQSGREQLQAQIGSERQISLGLMKSLSMDYYHLPARTVALTTQLYEEDFDIKPVDVESQPSAFCEVYNNSDIPNKTWMLGSAGRTAFMLQLACGYEIHTGSPSNSKQLIWMERDSMTRIQDRKTISADVLSVYYYLFSLLLEPTTTSLEFAIATSMIQTSHQQYPPNNKDASRYPFRQLKEYVMNVGIKSFTRLQQACIIQLAQIWAFKDQNSSIFGGDYKHPKYMNAHPITALFGTGNNPAMGSDDFFCYHRIPGYNLYLLKDRTGEWVIAKMTGSEQFDYCAQWQFSYDGSEGQFYKVSWGWSQDQSISWDDDKDRTILTRYMWKYHSLESIQASIEWQKDLSAQMEKLENDLNDGGK